MESNRKESKINQTSDDSLRKKSSWKRIHPSKAPVGVAPPPQLKRVKSKVGSLDNIDHKPKGGDKKIQTEKLKWEAKAKVGSLDNINHIPGGGNKKIFQQTKNGENNASENNSNTESRESQEKKLNRHAECKERRDSSLHKIDASTSISRESSSSKRLPPIKAPVGKAPPPNIKRASSKVGSLDNIDHKPKSSGKKIETRKLEWEAEPKVGSLENADHVPGGGAKKVPSYKVDFRSRAQSKVGSLANIDHKPGGGNVKIIDEKLDFKEKAVSKVGSWVNLEYRNNGLESD